MRAFEQRKKSNPSSETFFSPKIQAKLKTGTEGDRYEVEADRVADKVVNNTPSGGLVQSKKEDEVQKKPISETISTVQKKDMKEEKPVQKKEEDKVQKKSSDKEDKVQKKEEDKVQKKEQSGNTATSSIETTLSSSKGKGSALDKNTKQEMETGFGADFSNVKIHTDSASVQMSQELGAQAFTSGNDVYFNEGKYNPNSKEGKHLLAHELTHTVQQQGSKSIQMNKGNGAKRTEKKSPHKETGILSGEFGHQLSANFYTEENTSYTITIKHADIREGETSGCSSFDVFIDGTNVKTINPDKKTKTTTIPLTKPKEGKHSIVLNQPDFCMGFFKVSVTLK